MALEIARGILPEIASGNLLEIARGILLEISHRHPAGDRPRYRCQAVVTSIFMALEISQRQLAGDRHRHPAGEVRL